MDIWNAADVGNVEALAKAIEASPSLIDTINEATGTSPLLRSVERGHLECFELLVRSGSQLLESSYNDLLAVAQWDGNPCDKSIVALRGIPEHLAILSLDESEVLAIRQRVYGQY